VVHDWGGDGDPVLLAHPTGFHGRAWAPVATRLVERGRHVWSFDFRGHGDSDRSPDGTYSWSEFAQDALAVAHHLGVAGDPRLLAAGHSKGGASLLAGSVSEPSAYPRIWTFEPIIIPLDAPILAEQENPLSRGARKRRNHWTSRDEALASYSSKPPLNALAPEALQAYVDYGMRARDDGGLELKCRPEDEAQMYTMGASLGLSPHLAEITVPVLVGAGADTTSITPEMAGGIASRLAHGSLEVWKGCGHFGPLEECDLAVTSMLRFAEATAEPGA
jgi:pimeloyl-ACP methyl ester carboxylesterase